ncbi:MAG: ABC transporter permease [Terriglobales bacterium]
MRAAWQFPWLEALGQDLRFAARSLRRTPGFTLGVVATLALGIGVNTAIFSLAYGVLWKPLPYPDPGRIVALRQAKGAWRHMMNSGADIAAARTQSTGLQSWAMYRSEGATLTGAGTPETLWGAEAEPGLFTVLGVKPLAGRLFTPADAHPGAAPVALIGERLWRARFGARTHAVGGVIQLEGKPYTIAGVLPAGFDFPAGQGGAGLTAHPEYWRPWTEPPEPWGNRDVAALARLAPGVTLARARRGLALAMARLRSAHSEDKAWSFVALPMRDLMVSDVAPTLWVMLGVVGAVLLIAAANIAALLMARAHRRSRELATRAALGASRGRILRQLLTETGLLLSLGAGLGLALAELGIQWLRWQAPPDLPRIAEVGMNLPVLAFTAAVALVVGALFGLAPAWRASAPSLETSLRQGGPALAGYGGRGRSALVSVQVALSLVLLVAAGLLLKAFWRETAVPLGFNPGNALTFSLTLPQSRYPDTPARKRFYDAARRRLAVLPGVEAMALANSLPLEGEVRTGYSLPGHPLKPNDDSQDVEFDIVSADFFRALEIPVLAGRGFSPADSAAAPPVAVVSQAMAATVFRGRNPIGQRIQFSWGTEPWRTVVGVVGDARPGLGDQPSPA